MKAKLEASWLARIGGEFSKPYMSALKGFLLEEKEHGKTIYPQGSLWFNAFNQTAFDSVKVVILGQDPYHGTGQAHGLCFSVLSGVKIPPSLRNIYQELETDMNVEMSVSGDLSGWANQGVLLLNATLTVEANNAGSHQGKGWEQFTDAVVSSLDKESNGLVFMLWGSYAQKKGAYIDRRKHLVLEAPHPSPLSAYRGFFGCKHFSQANQYLLDYGKEPIQWQL